MFTSPERLGLREVFVGGELLAATEIGGNQEKLKEEESENPVVGCNVPKLLVARRNCKTCVFNKSD